MQYSLDQLEAFVAAEEAGSFSAAARMLGKAQSRVSTAVANLEIDLGVQLFDRSHKFPVVTEAGERLLPYARRVLKECRALDHCALQLSGMTQTQLRLSVDELFPSKVLGSVLGKFATQFPDIEVEVLWTAIGDVHSLIESGQADVGISLPLEGIAAEGQSWRLLGTIWAKGFVAASHPLALLPSVTEDDLWPYTQIIAASRSGKEEPGSGRFSERIWRCEDSQLMRELVINGVGWAWLIEHYAQQDIEQGRLVELHLKFSPKGIPSTFYFEWKKDYPLRPAEEWLAAELEHHSVLEVNDD